MSDPLTPPAPLSPSFWRWHRGAVLYQQIHGTKETAAYPLFDSLTQEQRDEWIEKAERLRQQEDWSPRGPWVVWATDDDNDRMFDSVLNPWRDPSSKAQNWIPRSFPSQEEAEAYAKYLEGCLRIITGPPLFTFPPEQTS